MTLGTIDMESKERIANGGLTNDQVNEVDEMLEDFAEREINFQNMTKEELILYMNENMIHKDSQMYIAVSCMSYYNNDTHEYEPSYQPVLNPNYDKGKIKK